MAYFTLVINEVKPEDFEKLVDVQTAHKELKFLPQGGQQGVPPSMVTSSYMSTNPQSGALSQVRYEWPDAGVPAAIKLLQVFQQNP